MTAQAPVSRTLVVGPIGVRPWVPMAELVASLEALGHEVLVNGAPEVVLPTLEPLRPRVGRVVNSAPALLFWYLRMLLRWRRSARRQLSAARVDRILVWDPILAVLARIARPSGVEVVWVLAPEEGPRLYNRMLRVTLALSADRTITTYEAENRFARGRDTFVPQTLPRDPAPLIPGWVLLGSPRPPTAASASRLRARAASDPAMALVFNARDHDHVPAATLNALCEAAQPKAIWWAGDDEWVKRLGGVATEVVDASAGLDVDHRHLRALGAGATLLASVDNDGGIWRQLLRSEPHDSGWKRLSLQPDAPFLTHEGAWAQAAFPPSATAPAALLADIGETVSRCPACHHGGSSAPLTNVGGINVLRCGECGLWYASRTLPAEAVHTADYHTGAGSCGTDYVTETTRRVVEAVADRRLDALEELGIRPGRLLDVGAGLGHLVARAEARGWNAEGLDVVPAAAEAARALYGVTMHTGELKSLEPQPFDVVVLGQTLEHFSDPIAVLEQVREKFLAHDGHLLVEVPNVASLARRLQARRWMHWQPGDHHIFPSPQTLQFILERAGYSVVLLRTDSLLVPELAADTVALNLGLLSERVSKRWPQIGVGLRRTRVEPALRAATRLVDRLGHGQNVLAVARPR